MSKQDIASAVESWGKQVLMASGIALKVSTSTETEPADASRIVLNAKAEDYVKDGPGYYPVALTASLKMSRRSKTEFEAKCSAIEAAFNNPPAVQALGLFKFLQYNSASVAEKQNAKNMRDGSFTVNLLAAKI